jgi:hypothetical protein
VTIGTQNINAYFYNKPEKYKESRRRIGAGKRDESKLKNKKEISSYNWKFTTIKQENNEYWLKLHENKKTKMLADTMKNTINFNKISKTPLYYFKILL